MLLALQKFGNTLEEYLHMILPPVVKLFDTPDVPISVSRVAMETIDHHIRHISTSNKHAILKTAPFPYILVIRNSNTEIKTYI